MAPAELFTFGIPLMPRAAAGDWRRVEALIGLTLASVRAQTDGALRVIIAGHDRPGTMPRDGRFAFLEGHWQAAALDQATSRIARRHYRRATAVGYQLGPG